MREMRRKDRLLPQQEAWECLKEAEYGVLSTVGEDGTPYGVPLNFAVEGESLYIHCAKKGHKLDNLRHQPQVSFCAVGKTQPVYTDGFTTYFESAIAFGRAVEIEDAAEKKRALLLLCEKYLPEAVPRHFEKDVAASMPATGVWRIDIHSISGKAKR